MTELDRRTALVTGGSRGIGRAIALRLAADGTRVVVHYGNDKDAAARTVADIEQGGGEAVAVRADLAEPDAVDVLFDGVTAALGADARLDILVNNAGIGLFMPFAYTTPDAYDHAFAINTRAPFFITQRALPILNDGGRIVFTTSGNTKVALGVVAAYAMTKAALEMLTRCLAVDLGPRQITVNAIMPGVTDTDMADAMMNDPGAVQSVVDMTALGRIGQPDDVAAAVAFLTSPDGHWVTGHVLDATGGMWIGPQVPSGAPPAATT